MRLYKQCCFLIGTKIPFSEWPALVDRYLETLGLEYRSFLYDFEDMDLSGYYQKILSGESCSDCRKLQACELCRREARRALERKSACQRLLADCPSLGALSCRTEKGFRYHSLSNLSFPGKEAHDLLMPLMPKIHKSYGFTETYLCYHDVRFFSRSWPASIDASAAGLEGVWGPSILLRRWQVTPSQNGIILHVDIGDGSEVLDASPYLDAMAELLPGVRRMESTHAELTPREQAELEEIQRRAEPAAAAASAFFAGSFPAPTEQGCSGAVSLAPALKRLCRQYSYRYLCAAPRLYRAEKQTANGHFITLEFDTGRTGCEANVLISLEGLGFSRRIASILCHPTDQKDAESHLHKVFAALGEAEDTVLAKLDRMYPPSPEWYGSVRNA